MTDTDTKQDGQGARVHTPTPDHEHIWLQNADDAKHQYEGRLWCEDKVWPDNDEDGEPTKYVRADLHNRLKADLAAAQARVAEQEKELAATLAANRGFAIAAERLSARMKALEEANARLIVLAPNAYNEGFIEGMREKTSRRGGNTWPESQTYKKYASLNSPNPSAEKGGE